MNNTNCFVFSAWIARRAKLDQCLELQLFNRDCEQAETWMAAREQSLRDDQEGGSVDQLIKKHEDFDRAINSQEEKISALQNLAEHLISNNHYDSPGIAQRRDQVLDRCVCFYVVTGLKSWGGGSQKDKTKNTLVFRWRNLKDRKSVV